ncbi:Anticodon binding domain containing protein [Trichomonas vaginalis G3]|uniref:proline--tRNA ligase n=2 Tax=Trichomonas vaginalis TaxID=5722 RepID=A2FGU9_TRIV3|nr:synthetase family [Trichomonas vaginalis G3]EAX95853.1 Anticodon binding domain containing protein [Trichomonas vaginalis G3]KAI5488671.1 synthetase family [Trichomonas vaginalis G3]|eukprot:XP_001308783.1 Anticodon binding domain containing protein [Trichomonas vaginalis G3]
MTEKEEVPVVEQKGKPQKQKGQKKEKPQKQQGKQEKKQAQASQRADLTFHVPKSNFSDWYEELMVTAGIVDKRWDIKGMPIFCSYGYTMHNEIMHLFEVAYSKIGVPMTQFPAFIPRSFLEAEADHVKGFQSECFWHEDEMCLRPTSETAMYSMFAKWVKTIEDLPVMVQQSCNVYRYETKGTKPLIRVREIPWNEAHTAHATPQEALDILGKFWDIVHDILTTKLSIDGLRLRRPDWDRFPGAEFTDVLDVVMPCGRVLQSVGAHYLGQHFSKVFKIQVDGEFSYMTCIGVSTRCLAAVLSAHGDDKGLIIPTIIAPIQVVIVPILRKDNDALLAKVAEMKKELRAAGIRVHIDDDTTRSPGEKFYYWEMKGVPLRIEVGPRDLEKNECVLVVRGIEGKYSVHLSAFAQECQDWLVKYDDALRERALAHLHSRIVDCNNLDDLPGILEKGGFARIPYWTMGKEGKEGAERVHDICGGEIRGYRPFEEQPAEGVKCLLTGKPAKFWAYVARSY